MKNLCKRLWTIGTAATCVLASTAAGQKQATVPPGASGGPSFLSVQVEPFHGIAPFQGGELVLDLAHAAIGRRPFWAQGVKIRRQGAFLRPQAAQPAQSTVFSIQVVQQAQSASEWQVGDLSDRIHRMLAPTLRKRGDGVALRVKGTLLPAQQVSLQAQVTQTQTAYVLQISDELAQAGGISDRRKASGGTGFVFGSLQSTSRALGSVLLAQVRKQSGGALQLRKGAQALAPAQAAAATSGEDGSRGLVRDKGKELQRQQGQKATPRRAGKR